MNVREVIDSIIDRNKEIQSFLENEGSGYSNGVIDSAAQKYIELLQKWNFNSGLGADFANVLLLINDEKLITQFDLQDVGRLFESLIKLQEYNLDIYVDLAHFEHAIMGNSEYAKQITIEGIKRAKQKVEELESLLQQIEKEK